MKKHIFTPGTGMSVENSTAEERKEIWELLFDNGYKVYCKRNREIEDFDYSIYFSEKKCQFQTCRLSSVTNPLTYAQMKALILGDTSKMPFKAACEAIKHGTHQIEKDCDNLDLLRDVLKEAFPEHEALECFLKDKLENGHTIFKRHYAQIDELSFQYYESEENLPIIKLSEIMPKEVNIPLMAVDASIKAIENAETLNKTLAKTNHLLEKLNYQLNQNKEFISQNDCIGRDIPVEEKPVRKVSGNWYKKDDCGNLIYFKDGNADTPILTRKEAEEKLNVKIVD